jgi:hypothetical protein
MIQEYCFKNPINILRSTALKWGVLLFLVGYLSGITSAAIPNQNLLNYSNFESENGSAPLGWDLLWTAGTYIKTGTEGNDTYAGTHAVYLSSTGPEGRWQSQYLIPVTAGQRIDFSGYVRLVGSGTASTTRAFIRCDFYNASAQYVSVSTDAGIVGTDTTYLNTWRKVGFSAKVPKDVAYVKAMVILTGAGSAYFDELCLKSGDVVNGVVNPELEEENAAGTAPTGWTPDTVNGGTLVYVKSSAQGYAQSSTHSLAIIKPTSSISRWLGSDVTAVTGHTFRYTAYVYAWNLDSDDKAMIRCDFKDSKGAYVSSTIDAGVQVNTTWKKLEYTFTVPSGVAYVQPQVIFSYGANASASASAGAYFDDITLVDRTNEIAFENGLYSADDKGVLEHYYYGIRDQSNYAMKFSYDATDTNTSSYWTVGNGISPGVVPAWFDALKFDIYLSSNTNSNLAIYFTDSYGSRWYFHNKALSNYTANQWQTVTIPRSSIVANGSPSDWNSILYVTVEVNSSVTSGTNNAKAVFYLDNFCLTGGSGSRVTRLFNCYEDGVVAESTWNRAAQVAVPDKAVLFPMDSITLLSTAYRDTPAKLKADFGVTDFIVPLTGFSRKLQDVVADQAAQGIATTYYEQPSANYLKCLAQNQGWDKTAAGTDMNTFSLLEKPEYSVHVYSHGADAIYNACQARNANILKAGLSTWSVIDYVLPWEGTSAWGYSQTMIDVYRKDLLGTDTGKIEIRDNTFAAMNGAMTFPKYFKYYHGFDLLPSHVGLTSWSNYNPPTTTATNAQKQVFQFLKSYEWLKLMDRAGRDSRTAGGQPLSVVLNPEDPTGSTDYLFMAKSYGVGNLFMELFQSPLGFLEGAYHSMPYLRSHATRAGNSISTIFETGEGGHKAPYWDWAVTYAATYASTGNSTARNMQNDFVGESSYATMSNSANTYQNSRYLDSKNKAKAFTLARSEGLELPAQENIGWFCVASRGLSQMTAGSLFFDLNQFYSLGYSISKCGYTFQQRDSCDLENVLNSNTRVLAYNPAFPRTGDLALIKNWLVNNNSTTLNRWLVTHTFVPTRNANQFWSFNNTDSLGNSTDYTNLGISGITRLNNTGFKVQSSGSDAAWYNYFSDLSSKTYTPKLTSVTGATGAGLRTLVNTNQGPLVVETTVGANKVIFLNFSSKDPENADVLELNMRVMKALATLSAGAYVECEKDTNALVQIFEIGTAPASGSNVQGKVCVVWDRPALKGWTAASGKLTQTGSNVYATSGKTHTVKIPIGSDPGGNLSWWCYDFFNDDGSANPAALTAVTPVNGQVTVTLSNATVGIYYLGPNTTGMQNTLNAARAARKTLGAY